MKEVRRRLQAIADRLQEKTIQIPDYEEFRQKWETMDEISKSLYVAYAECPELIGKMDRYHQAIFEYLQRMGFVNNRYNLADIVKELEEQ